MNTIRSGLVVIVAMWLTACMAPPYTMTEKFDMAPPGLDLSEIEKSGEIDSFGQSEVFTADNEDLHFGVAYTSTNDMGVIKEQIPTAKILLKSWTVLKEKKIEYGLMETKDLPGDGVTIEHFSYPGYRCFHFLSAFNRSMFDEFSRYKRLVTGYYCHAGETPLPDEAVNGFLNSITVPLMSKNPSVRDLPDKGYFKPVRPIRGPLIRSTKLWVN